MHEFISTLAPRQRREVGKPLFSVLHVPGPVLCMEGMRHACSGKNRVETYEIVHILNIQLMV